MDALSKIAPVLLPLRALLRSPKLEAHLGHPYRVARNLLRVLARPMPERGHIAQCLVDDVTLAGLGYDHPARERDNEQILAELAQGLEGVPVVRLAYKGKGAVGTNRSKLEGASAGHGVTLQSPFLHPGMRALAASIPDRLFRPDERTRSADTGKYALMHMASRARLLPDEIIYQTKRSPVTAPVDQWYANELRANLLGAMEALPFDFDHDFAEAMVSQKLTEEAFRRHVGISRFAFHAPSLLATYASFCRVAQPSGRHG